MPGTSSFPRFVPPPVPSLVPRPRTVVAPQQPAVARALGAVAGAQPAPSPAVAPSVPPGRPSEPIRPAFPRPRIGRELVAA